MRDYELEIIMKYEKNISIIDDSLREWSCNVTAQGST